MSFDTIKLRIAEEIGLDLSTVKGMNDVELLEQFYDCKWW